jgi:hypothetical protein
MNGRRSRASDQNYCFLDPNLHSDTLRVDLLTRTAAKLLNPFGRSYSSQLADRQPRRRVSAFYTLRM